MGGGAAIFPSVPESPEAGGRAANQGIRHLHLVMVILPVFTLDQLSPVYLHLTNQLKVNLRNYFCNCGGMVITSKPKGD